MRKENIQVPRSEPEEDKADDEKGKENEGQYLGGIETDKKSSVGKSEEDHRMEKKTGKAQLGTLQGWVKKIYDRKRKSNWSKSQKEDRNMNVLKIDPGMKRDA